MWGSPLGLRRPLTQAASAVYHMDRTCAPQRLQCTRLLVNQLLDIKLAPPVVTISGE